MPEGNFDLVVSAALAMHHLDGAGKADLLAASSTGSGRADGSCLAALWYPTIPVDVVTPIDGVYDQPSTVGDKFRWLAAAGLDTAWAGCASLAVIVADSPS